MAFTSFLTAVRLHRNSSSVHIPRMSDTNSVDNTYVAGVSVVVACTLFNSTGMLLQRLAHSKINKDADDHAGNGHGDGSIEMANKKSPIMTRPLPLRSYGTGASASGNSVSGVPHLALDIARRASDGTSANGQTDLERATGLDSGSVTGSHDTPTSARSVDSIAGLLSSSRSMEDLTGLAGADSLREGGGSPSRGDSQAGALRVAKTRREELIARGWFCLSGWWLAGITCQVFGGLSAVAGITLIGQARCAVFAGLTLMWSQLFATLFLKERFTWVDGSATCLIAAGSTVAAVFGAEGAGNAASPTFESLLIAMRNNTARASGAVIGLVMGSLLATLFYRWRIAKITTKSNVECVLLAVTGGFFSCWASAGAKLVSSAFSTSLGNKGDVFNRPYAYFCLLGEVAALGCQIGFLNMALKRYDALSAIPPYECVLTLLGVAFGWLFLGEATGTSPETLSMFVLGSCLCAGGVVVLGFKSRLLRHRPELFPGGHSSATAVATDAVSDCMSAVASARGDDGSASSAVVATHGGGSGGAGGMGGSLLQPPVSSRGSHHDSEDHEHENVGLLGAVAGGGRVQAPTGGAGALPAHERPWHVGGGNALPDHQTRPQAR